MSDDRLIAEVRERKERRWNDSPGITRPPTPTMMRGAIRDVERLCDALEAATQREARLREENERLRAHFHVYDGWCMQCGALPHPTPEKPQEDK